MDNRGTADCKPALDLEAETLHCVRPLLEKQAGGPLLTEGYTFALSNL